MEEDIAKPTIRTYLGYCVKCKVKKEMKNPEIVVMKNDREAVKGECPDCGAGMFKILGYKSYKVNTILPKVDPEKVKQLNEGVGVDVSDVSMLRAFGIHLVVVAVVFLVIGFIIGLSI